LNRELEACLKVDPEFVNPVRQVRIALDELAEHFPEVPLADGQSDVLDDGERGEGVQVEQVPAHLFDKIFNLRFRHAVPIVFLQA
jgi:hypothetical protein